MFRLIEVRNDIERIFMLSSRVVSWPSRSLSKHSSFHVAVIAFVCAAISLLSGISPAHSEGSNWPTSQIGRSAEQIASSQAVAPIDGIDVCLAEDFHEEVVELTENTDDDETKHLHLPVGILAFGSQSVLYELSADRERALTPFRLRAFSNRGSPSV